MIMQLLKEIAIISAGQGAPQGDKNYCDNGTPFVKAGNLQELVEGYSINNIQKVSDSVAKSHKLKLYSEGTVLFAKSGMSCLKGYVYVLPCDAYVVSHLACITPKRDISQYLKYYFNYNKPNQLVKDPAYPSISLSDIGGLRIDLKDESKRNNIVLILSKIEQVISLRKMQLQQFDELVKAQFIEMFGDPVLNPYNWDVVTIGDVVTDVRYGTSRPAIEGGKYPYLRMNNLTYDGHLDLHDLKYIDIPENEIDKCIVHKGDVLFNRTNSVELVGKTCVFDLDEDMVIAGYIIRVRLNNKITPIFLSSYMNSTVLKEQLKCMAKGAVNQANINAQELQSIKIYLPPTGLQNEFADFVKQIDKSKVVVQKALNEAQMLFDSLMQEYFG